MGVTVRLGGIDYDGWHAVSVQRGLEQAAAQFSCTVSERTTDAPMEPWVLRPGSPCSILLDGELVVTGYIDTYMPRYDAHSHGVEIRGRSRTADFVDGAAIVPGGQFKQLSLLEIAERLAAPFGLNVALSAGMAIELVAETLGLMPPLQDVQVQQGETCHALLERLARLQGLLITDTAAGELALTRVGSGVAVAALVQGENILGASAELDASQRFSQYIVKGQRANTDDREDGALPAADVRTTQAPPSAAGDSVRACLGAVLDSVVGRYRPWLITAETQADDRMCQQRAEWEARRRAGHATRASVVVAGWRQVPGGPLWDVNLLVPVVSPWLGIDRVLLISSVEFRKDDGGSTTRLELTLPDAYAAAGDAVPGETPATGGTPIGGADLWGSGSIAAIVQGAGGIFL